MKTLKNRILLLLFITFTVFAAAVISVAAEHNHIYTVLYTVRPTCTEKGYTVFSCNCGESYEGAVINSLGHNFSADTVCYKNPTCLEKGEAGRYCLRCYEKTDVIYYERTPHKPVTVTVKATNKTDGEIRKECCVCRKLYSSNKTCKIASVKLDKKTYTYDGKTKTPTVTVKDSEGEKLIKNTDYIYELYKDKLCPLVPQQLCP